MACGVPVVGSDSGEIPHVIGNAGLIFPEGSAAGLHTALQQLLNSAELAHHYAELGWQRVREHYTQHQIAGKTVATYRTMLTQ